MTVWLLGFFVVAPTMLPFTSIAQGATSGIAEPQQIVVRSAGAWQRLWTAHAPDESVPEIDFTTSMVVGVLLGSRPTPGFHVEITTIESDGDATVVNYVVRTPQPGMVAPQILIAPFHFVRLARRDGAVRFVKVDAPKP